MKKLIAIVLCCLLLTACAPGAPAPTEPLEQPEITQPEPTFTEPVPTETEPSEPQMTEPELWVFHVYRGNENVDGLLAREVAVTELTAEVIMSMLIEDGVIPADAAVNSLERDGTQLNIDFNETFLNYLCTMGTSGEMILVSSVVNTFLSAYGAESVMFTVNGEIVESGHVIYDFPLTYSDNVVYESHDLIEE